LVVIEAEALCTSLEFIFILNKDQRDGAKIQEARAYVWQWVDKGDAKSRGTSLALFELRVCSILYGLCSGSGWGWGRRGRGVGHRCGVRRLAMAG